MRSWWGKSSSKDVRRKSTKESFIDIINRKLKIFTTEKSSGKSGSSRRRRKDKNSVKGSQSRVSRSPSPSTPDSRSQVFADRTSSQPLPLPEGHSSNVHLVDSDNSGSIILVTGEVSEPSLTLPLPMPRHLPHGPTAAGVDRDLPTASVSCDCSSDSDDLTDSRFLSPQTSDYENGSRTALNSPSSLKQKVQSPIASNASSGEMLKSATLLSDNQAIPTSPRQRLLRSHVPPGLQIPHHGASYSAPDSSMSSPSRSPMRVFGHETVMNPGFWLGKPHGEITFLGSGHCSSPGSGQNSGHNSIGGDMLAQPFWPHSRCSPECSPVPSPRMTSPGPGSRIHSGAVTPLHPRAGGTLAESSTASLDNGKQQSHRLPLPPISIPHSSTFSLSCSMTPAIPRSPGRTGNPPSPGPRWKKGRLIGRGTFGHVYLGFNRSVAGADQYFSIVSCNVCLSDEGKDFVRQCLQRNPLHRPTASQLLKHPFVKSTAPMERFIVSPEPSVISQVESGFRQLKVSLALPDSTILSYCAAVPRSCPVSPVGIESPVYHSQSPKHMSGRLSPSTISSPRAVSGSSTPLSGGGGAVPLSNPIMPTTSSSEDMGTSPKAQSCFYPDAYTSHGLKSDMSREAPPYGNGFFGENFGGHAQSGVNGQPYQGQSVLANRVAQQLLRDQVKLSPSFDLNPGSPVFSWDNGV